jgi:hypothetical protein
MLGRRHRVQRLGQGRNRRPRRRLRVHGHREGRVPRQLESGAVTARNGGGVPPRLGAHALFGCGRAAGFGQSAEGLGLWGAGEWQGGAEREHGAGGLAARGGDVVGSCRVEK